MLDAYCIDDPYPFQKVVCVCVFLGVYIFFERRLASMTLLWFWPDELFLTISALIPVCA